MLNVKKKFLSYLLIVAVILLFANILTDSFKKKTLKPNAKELSRKEIENVVWKVLDDYGIQANWVAQKKYKQADEDSINNQFIISIPADVPIPLIIKDVNNVIEKDISAFVSEEHKIFGETEIRIYTNELLKLKALLKPDKNLNRKKCEVSFVISDAFDLSEDKFYRLLTSHYPLACAVVPDPNYVVKADTMSKYSKEYLLFISDKVDDSKMKMVQDYKKEILRKSVLNILTAFPAAKLSVIDESSTLFNSPIYNFVRDEFKIKKSKLVHLSEFIRLENTNEQETLSKFKFYIEDTISKQKVFYTTFDNFGKMQPLLEKYKRKGSKVLPISKCYIMAK